MTTARPKLPPWVPRANAALAMAWRKVRVIAANTPLNLEQELRRLRAVEKTSGLVTPRFLYSPPPDHREVRRALTELAAELATLGPLGGLYADRGKELALDAALCESAGGVALWALARTRYARRDDYDAQADELAETWLAAPSEPPPKEGLIPSDDERAEGSLLRRMRQEIGRRKLPVRVAVSANLSALAATGDGFVLVAKGRALSPRDVERTVLHEIEGHVLPRLDAVKMDLGIFEIGTAHGLDDQEGRALVLEQMHGFLDGRRRRELALRHVAARSVEARASFVETARLLRERAAPLDQALSIAARVHRGGGLGREAVYLPAFLRVQAALQVHPSLDYVLRIGRVSVAAAEVLREWVPIPSSQANGRLLD